MKKHNDENKITVSAIYRLLLASFLSSILFAVFFNIFRSDIFIDSLFPILNSLVFLSLLGYFHQDPYVRISKTIYIYIVITILTFIPTTTLYLWMAWQKQVSFVDNFPPISGIIIATLTLGLIMLPRQYKKYVVLFWASIALPIIYYLVSHPDELHTKRGYELLCLFGPASFLLYVVSPYQKSIRRHMTKVTGDLRRFEEAASRDFLTDLYNRRGLQGWLGLLNHDDKISVLIIDIDHFKNINDRYGHATGDHVLVEVASRLRSIYFEKHTIARWGGEEFAVLLVNPKANTLPYIGTMFQNTLSTLPYKSVGKVTVSIGVSTIAHHENFLELTDQADKALYIAKNNGRDQSVMYNSIHPQLAD
ncbi:GGDEF domain-containing protein [Marinomonas polaris]|uniref:GGDEF domain-containing protein n=1 Tax=Marinomonas polaris TaxID=293552 RepID=UPI003F966E48